MGVTESLCHRHHHPGRGVITPPGASRPGIADLRPPDGSGKHGGRAEVVNSAAAYYLMTVVYECGSLLRLSLHLLCHLLCLW